MFKHKMTNLDGEGVGRFTARLVEGILTVEQDSYVHVVMDTVNGENVSQLFERARQGYTDRLQIYQCDPYNRSMGITWVNLHVPVDIWIVPYVGLELALQLYQPYILCLHDLVHTHFPKLYIPQFRDYFRKFDSVVQAVAEKSSAVAFSSKFTWDNEGNLLGLPAEKTKVIRLAAPVEEYRQMHILNEGSLRNKYVLPNEYMVYPSAIRLHKNHVRLIEAFLKFKKSPQGSQSNVGLVLTDHYMNSPVKGQISSVLNDRRYRDVRNSVQFIGRVPPDDLPSLYKYAVGTIVPTLFEGSFPFQILESLLMETPVTCSHLEVVKELLSDVNAFAPFNPDSVDEIESSISRLCRDSRSMLERQRESICCTLDRTWADVAIDYLELAHRITEDKKPK